MIRDIVKNIKELRRPCEDVLETDDYKSIIQDLKDTLKVNPNGIALSAIQIGVNKKISYLRIPTGIDEKTKEIQYFEKILINPEIIQKDKKILLKDEGCLSFPGMRINTDRYIFVIVKFLDENFKEQTELMQDLVAFAVQHEVDHTNGMTILDRKHRDVNRRK